MTGPPPGPVQRLRAALHRFAWAALAVVDYALLARWIGRLPGALAPAAIVLRGTLNFALDLDWRTLALRQRFVRERTRQAMARLRDLAGADWRPLPMVWRRFLCSAREEYDIARLGAEAELRVDHAIAGLEALESAAREGRGVLLLTAHYDSLYVGLAILARRGWVLNLMSTRLVESDALPAPVRAFWHRKLEALRRHLRPGRVVHAEDGLRGFVHALRRGEVVVMACDGPAVSAHHATVVDFLGARHAMSGGIDFLAEKAAPLIALYSCVRDRDGTYRISISQPLDRSAGGIQRAYAELERRILAEPWRWWAADLLHDYLPVP